MDIFQIVHVIDEARDSIEAAEFKLARLKHQLLKQREDQHRKAGDA